MQYVKDRINYQGKRYDYIAFDELTHFSWEEYSYLFSRNRPSGPGTRVYMRASTEPGRARGHGWVKERFITVAPPMTRVVEEMELPGPDGKLRKNAAGPDVCTGDGIRQSGAAEKRAGVSGQPEHAAGGGKKALLLGDWDSFLPGGVHRVAQRPGALRGSAVDARGQALSDTGLVADLPGV